MTITSGSLSSAYYNPQVTKSPNNSSSSFSVTSDTTSELTEEEKLYDTDGDGVLNVTEKEAYTKAQSARKAMKTTASALESGDEKNQTIKKMWDKLSLARQAVLSRITPFEQSGNTTTAKSENLKQKDDNKISSMIQQAIEMYTAY